MSDSEDSYAGYNDFADLTEEDLLALGTPDPTTLASTSRLPELRDKHAIGAPSVAEEVKGDITTSNDEDDDMPPAFYVAHDFLEDIEDVVKAPAALYRRRGVFSVSDLCAPQWCEVQFDYGLRGKRSRPLQDRPRSFKSSKGKEITVAPEIEAKNDARTKGGREIHKELEREIMAEPIYVRITCDEEKWALRLVNLIMNLRQLMIMGIARETPVFGIIHDEVVVGIIDEIHMKPYVLPAPKTPKRTRLPLSQSQNTIDKYLSPKKSTLVRSKSDAGLIRCYPVPPPPPRPSYTLSLLDTKTRTTRSIPSDVDALPSRIQLMLYQRILSDLLRASPSFDFAYLWAKLDLDPYRPFPTTVLKDTGMLPDTLDGGQLCLSDVVELWWKLRDELNAEVASRLQLVYRLIPEGERRGRRGKSCRRESSLKVKEDEDLARAIQASLDDLREGETPPVEPVEGEVNGATPSHSEEVAIPAIEDVAVTDTTGDKGDNSGAPSSPSLEVIGTKEFMMDDPMLDAHVESVFQWWRGERAPQGVPVELARRCHTCEYMQDCEWREAKAQEARAKVEQMRTGYW
ncbi:exonuclease V [Schizophyllum commune]